jgi:hypothetical protein
MHIDRRTSVKVPEVTAIFWIVKVLTTGMGETTSDFFIHRVGVNNKARSSSLACQRSPTASTSDLSSAAQCPGRPRWSSFSGLATAEPSAKV